MKKVVLFALLCVLLVSCATEVEPPVSETPKVSAASDMPDDAQLSFIPSAEPTLIVMPTPKPTPEPTPKPFEWTFDTPGNHGIDSALLAELHTTAADTDITSFVIIKDGVIIDEYYADGYDETSVFRMHSVTKSFTSALWGIALNEELISGTDVMLSDYFDVGDDKADITAEHLLTHTSGLDWPEWNGPIWNDFARAENTVEFILSRPMVNAPGRVFNYTTGGSHLLGAIIEKAAGESMYDYALPRLLEPLEIDSVRWSSDPQGITDGGNGLSLSARDAAKLGLLYLNGGVWRGEQIIPAEWVAFSTEAHASGYTRYGKYSYQWWVKPFGGYDAYYALGHGGQYIIVVPDLNLVAVFTSKSSANIYTPQPLFEKYVVGTCVG